MKQVCGTCNFNINATVGDNGRIEVTCAFDGSRHTDDTTGCSKWVEYISNISTHDRISLALSDKQMSLTLEANRLAAEANSFARDASASALEANTIARDANKVSREQASFAATSARWAKIAAIIAAIAAIISTTATIIIALYINK